MVCLINATQEDAIITNCSTIGIPRNATFEEKLKAMEYNDKIEILSGTGMYKVTGPGIGGIHPVYEVYTLYNIPITDVIIQFFYSYWYLIALIILGIIAAIAL